ncbi:MAG: radical SAM protein [Candidatus Omnitrophica bacterium]|nr:radical SAM protein [Candidatus Omnitrophota bacterium]
MPPQVCPYVFGPVPSRRLGRSFGIDLAPYKTCSYDCVYCQLGRTTVKTVERKEWVPLEEVLSQVKQRLSELSEPPDYITLSGSGEPTLFSRIDELIDGVKSITSTPTAILTNGSLLWDQEVRKQVKKADLIVPSLDAGSEELFHCVNRPHPSLSFSQMVEGLIKLREEYEKPYWLEVFLLAGHSAIESEIEQIKKWIKAIRPDRVQLNTVVRPPAEEYAYTVPKNRLKKIADSFDPPAELIADYQKKFVQFHSADMESHILSILHRRPCTLSDLSESVNLHPNAVVKYLDHLLADNQILVKVSAGKSYYTKPS